VGIVSDLPTGPPPSDDRPRRWTGAGVPYMSAPERDERIVELRRRGLSYARIGKAVGLSANGVMHSLRRIAEGRPGRDARG
jgi:hypothetical protein